MTDALAAGPVAVAAVTVPEMSRVIEAMSRIHGRGRGDMWVLS